MKKTMIVLFLIILMSAVNFIQPTNILSTDELADEYNATELPKFYIYGDVAGLKNKSEEIKISVKYESFNKSFESYAKIKLQGSSSLSYEKKNYTIKFYKDEELSEKHKINFGWGKQYKYCLKANWIDKTHSRNIVSARLVGDVQKKYNLFMDAPNNGAIDGTPVEIYLNDDFLGLYTLNIPKDEWLFNLDDDNENHFVVSAAARNTATLFKKNGDFSDWEVEAGLESEENLRRLNRLVSFVKDSSDKDFRNNIENYFNLDALLNYYVIMEFGQFFDNVSKNLLLVTYDGKIWYPSLYDLDSTWGTHWGGRWTMDYSLKMSEEGSLLWEKVARCFPNELADRYFILRKDVLNKENVIEEFLKFNKSIPKKSFESENQRWSNIPGFGIEQIEDFLDKRIPLVDSWFRDLYTEENAVTVVYEKNIDGSITAKLKNLRKDIIVLGDDTYTFTKDGIYTFKYTNYVGDKNFIIAEATGIKYNFER